MVRSDEPANVDLPEHPGGREEQQAANFPAYFASNRVPVPAPFVVEPLPPRKVRGRKRRGDEERFTPFGKDGRSCSRSGAQAETSCCWWCPVAVGVDRCTSARAGAGARVVVGVGEDIGCEPHDDGVGDASGDADDGPSKKRLRGAEVREGDVRRWPAESL